jgi:hypothetical protein
MRPFGTGSDYVNQIGLETNEGSERIKAAFEVDYDRLVALKNKYDPTKAFRRTRTLDRQSRDNTSGQRPKYATISFCWRRHELGADKAWQVVATCRGQLRMAL